MHTSCNICILANRSALYCHRFVLDVKELHRRFIQRDTHLCAMGHLPPGDLKVT